MPRCIFIPFTLRLQVKGHKTAATFGRAKIPLNAAEFQLLLDFDRLSPLLPGYPPAEQHFFFNSAGGELKKLGEYVTEAWQEFGISGVTVTKIRTSISTLVSFEETSFFPFFPPMGVGDTRALTLP